VAGSNLLLSATALIICSRPDRFRHLRILLINELPKAKSDTERVKLLSNISKVLTPFSPDQALNYANKAMDLATKVNWTTGIGLAHMNKATIYVTITDYVAGLKMPAKLLISLNP
jgi:hypothetical protein